MPSGKITSSLIWQALEDVKDPEIPVVSVVEMGIVRQVEFTQGRAVITITPTFAGCPALAQMQHDITAKVKAMGVEQVNVETILHPPWSSDWITDEARQKLKTFGLAPPPKHQGNLLVALDEMVECPYCDSSRTTLKNSFGSTACRAIYYCHHCQQPFEQFKPL